MSDRPRALPPAPFPIIDTHVHLWDPNYLRYSWLDDDPLLNRPYLVDDYRAACGAVAVEKMVFLQCECAFAQYYDEALWVSELARQETRIQGMVPWAPLEKGEAAREDLEKLTQDPLVRGVRRIIQFEEDTEFCLRPGFVRGVQLCAEFDLHFEICISHEQMANALKMVRQCPDVRFILDHIGKPDIKNQLFEPWRAQMKELASLPNTWCKMSGLVVEADMDRWTTADLRPYIGHVLDVFGFERTMFGGDWPVVLQAARLDRWIETLYTILQGTSDSDMKRLFRENAIAFYRLNG
jgi:L-fuconolactonase